MLLLFLRSNRSSSEDEVVSLLWMACFFTLEKCYNLDSVSHHHILYHTTASAETKQSVVHCNSDVISHCTNEKVCVRVTHCIVFSNWFDSFLFCFLQISTNLIWLLLAGDLWVSKSDGLLCFLFTGSEKTQNSWLSHTKPLKIVLNLIKQRKTFLKRKQSG